MATWLDRRAASARLRNLTLRVGMFLVFFHVACSHDVARTTYGRREAIVTRQHRSASSHQRATRARPTSFAGHGIRLEEAAERPLGQAEAGSSRGGS